MEFNDKFFEEIGKSAGVTQICKEVAEKVLATAQASAPVDEGAYRDGLHVEVKAVEKRNVALVVGSDPKTMLIESKTGNLARALNRVKKSG
ncbi:HK97 gp10 family phage protein [Paenarthrobacter sp. GOM3]|uniref:HK97 gp10 family phage protein n=1 Tax=Paenarthrobacter sp. GOM3 TaxID=2782567 RepID=UPI001BACF494|nr:HK97 gp10 family phage protein [Paenarthrobacter sp. GOM3]WOH20129.1 HK97 gp10 family phage protein [Paenarthrobacter sp. GOM3]